ncbi:polysaccharide deacetylase family protein [Parahaliea aestuarii]|uniref:Polysaccharide deacetylase family protein n=1 Tax=Parahaliea aestuarii TaxID=1852021 RepID=A0A5C9A127_9GAMM|nr:polysaccharide deacetylase family protein [Parahaliea aestuarii]TXS93592.1 polysaccharide deacetylase family protein [Parahaliea aestuarii]
MIRPVLVCLLLWAQTYAALAADHGVILLYHRITGEGPAATRVTPAQFERHLDWLNDNGFKVLPLSQLLDDLFERGETQENAVAITFDDAYVSVYQEAFPRLRERDMPFSVFVATEAVDKGYGHYLDWGQIAEMQQSGLVEVGPHSLTHAHLEQRRTGDSQGDWEKRVSQEIAGSMKRLQARLPQAPIKVFAYPFGEYSAATLELLKKMGLRGLAQQSGAVGVASHAQRIPRFAMATGYDELERLATSLRARPMPVQTEEAQPFFLDVGASHPASFRLTLREGELVPATVSCFSSTGATLETASQSNDLTVSLPPLAAGRNKINCTAATGRKGEFYWYSRLWTLADEAGSWLEQ